MVTRQGPVKPMRAGTNASRSRRVTAAPQVRLAARPLSSRPRNAWWVYLLLCVDGSLYCGMTSGLHRRLMDHMAGRGSRYTRSRLPVLLVWRQPVATRADAARREAEIKKLKRPRKLALIARG